MKLFKSTNILPDSYFLASVGLSESEVKKMERIDYFCYSLDNGRVYDYSLYLVYYKQDNEKNI